MATRLSAAGARERVLVTPGPSFSVDGTFEHYVRLPFTLPPDDLTAAVARLASLASTLGAGVSTETAEPPAAPV